MCAARCSGVGESSASGPRLFSRCSAALARCEQNHRVTGSPAGAETKTQVRSQGTGSPPHLRAASALKSLRPGLGPKLSLCSRVGGGRRAVSGGYFSLTEDARAERAGQPPPLPAPHPPQEPAPGWVAPKARVSPAGDVRLAVTHPPVTDDSELAASAAVWRLVSVRRRGRGSGGGEARMSGC